MFLYILELYCHENVHLIPNHNHKTDRKGQTSRRRIDHTPRVR